MSGALTDQSLEVEVGPAPHSFGYTPIVKTFFFNSTQTGTALWTPASGKKIVLTGFLIYASGSIDAVTTLFAGTDTAANWIFKGSLDVVVDGSITIPGNFHAAPLIVPVDTAIKMTTDAAIEISGYVTGYEVPG